MDDTIETSESTKVYSFKTGKAIDPETVDSTYLGDDSTEGARISDAILSVQERMINMDEHLNGMVDRIIEEVGEDEFSQHTQLFLMIKKPGSNNGLLWTTYNLRGIDLVGALEAAKLIAAERYFSGDD